MASKYSTPPRVADLSVEQMTKGIATLRVRIGELEQFDCNSGDKNKLQDIQTAISESIERVFGSNTSDYQRYIGAARLDQGPLRIRTYGEPTEDRRRHVCEGKTRSLHILNRAVQVLQERIAEASPEISAGLSSPSVDKTHVFIVHGHDGELKHEVARFVNTLGLSPVILDEQVSKGRTIIEKFEQNSTVRFAIVLLSPDDEGNRRGDAPRPRARQNVILELGYFAGALGRDKVCALIRGEDIELPSDIHGMVSVSYNQDWKLKLARELKAAGFEIDLNKAV